MTTAEIAKERTAAVEALTGTTMVIETADARIGITVMGTTTERTDGMTIAVSALTLVTEIETGILNEGTVLTRRRSGIGTESTASGTASSVAARGISANIEVIVSRVIIAGNAHLLLRLLPYPRLRPQ